MRRIGILGIIAVLLAPFLANAQSFCPDLTRSLERGAEGEDVRQLQQFLVGRGQLTQAEMDTGPGIFGARTEAAVQNFQCAENIVCDGGSGWGIVGPQTRAKIAQLCGGVVGGTNATAASVPTTGLPPIVSIKVNGVEDVFLPVDAVHRVTWSSSRAFVCALSSTYGNGITRIATTSPNTSGVSSGITLDGLAEYTLNCRNPYGSVTQTARARSASNAGSCALDGVFVLHGESRTFYSESAPANATCDEISQVRTCENGALSGSLTHNKATCTSTAPLPGTPPNL